MTNRLPRLYAHTELVLLLDHEETTIDSSLFYFEGSPVRIHATRRGNRYDLTDDGAAVDLAGRRPGWLETAEQVVTSTGMNVNRRGVVFVPAFEGRDLDALCQRLAEASRQVYLALLEL